MATGGREKLLNTTNSQRGCCSLNEREHLLGQNVPMAAPGAEDSEELVFPSESMCSLVNMNDNETADIELLEADPTNSSGGTDGTEDGEESRVYHCHQPPSPTDRVARNQLCAVSVLCVVFMTAEIIGGLLAGSLAIATDATHMASDLAGFLISLFAIWIGQKPATKRLSFGYYRAEVVGALISVLIIWVVTAVIVVFAVRRIQYPELFELHGVTMLVSALIGVAFNVAMGAVLHCGVCKSCRIQHSHSHGGHSHGDHSHGGHSHGGHSHGDHNSCNNGHSHSLSRRIASDDSILLLADDTASSPPLLNGSQSSVDNIDRLNVATITTVDQPDGNLSCPDGVTYRQANSSPVHGEGNHKPVNINVRAAMVHVIGDIVQSFGVLIAAIVVCAKPEYKIADPICTFIFSFLVLCTTLGVLRDVFLIIMEGVPRNIDYELMKDDLTLLPGIKSVHSLNVWSLTMDKIALGVHLAVAPGVRWPSVLERASELLRRKYNVYQSTIQVEQYNSTVMSHCEQCRLP